ncbi:MAG TPA: ABC transporter substrate-binding protein [Devosia sp.]|nr:ABC transporter substrate-binding protein [Devosia sp.]
MVKFKLIGSALLALAAIAVPTAALPQDAAPAAPTEIAPKTPLPNVPRNQTLVLGWSIASPIGVTNPWAVPGYTHQEGNNLMFEPLQYYAIFANKYIPWLAESCEYTSKDFTSLEIKLNPAATWSDGTPVTADDVVYTFEGQMKNDKLPYHADFQEYVDSVTAVDKETVDVKFKIPAPRFKFEVLTLKFDTGIPIVPKAWEEKQKDVNAAAGGTDIPHSGPYDLVAWNANQKIYNLRENWWAIKAGLRSDPAVKRVVIVNLGGTVGQNMDTVAQRIVNNEMDSSLDMRAQVIGNILAQNPKVTSWTGNKSPFGYRDWWPNSLWMNTQLAPYNDVRVRKAMSLAINRDQIDQVLYDGAHVSTIYPFPLYPNLQKFADSPAVKAEEAKYNPGEYNLDKSAQLMTEAGFTKNGDGLWEKDGKTVNATINAFEGIHSDIAPVLVEMLRDGGFDAAVNFGADAQQNMNDGVPGLYLAGHGASLLDPDAALELFDGKYSSPVGAPVAGAGRYSRYKNPEYDKLLDEMAPLGADDPTFQADAAKALGIYWRDVIDIPIIQWLHRIPYNNTYWTNWPSETNLADGENGAFWAHTGMLEITNLKPSGAK